MDLVIGLVWIDYWEVKIFLSLIITSIYVLAKFIQKNFIIKKREWYKSLENDVTYENSI